MVTFRSISPDGLESWARLQDAVDRSLERSIRSAWERGASRSEWCFLAEEHGRPAARIGFIAEPAASTVPDLEARIVGLWVDPDVPDQLAMGRELLDRALATVQPEGFATVDGTVNPEYMPQAELRHALYQGAGFALFQEKEGFEWRAEAPEPASAGRLTFRSIDEVGPDRFVETMARAVAGTLDRNDRYYRDLAGGGDGWGREMLGYLGPDDGTRWLLGATADGEVAGYVLIGAFDEASRGTIVHIGVVPEQRGNGYIDELLLAGNAAARRRGFERMISDVDTQNGPMLAAMERAGHSSAATLWHVWHYRLAR